MSKETKLKLMTRFLGASTIIQFYLGSMILYIIPMQLKFSITLFAFLLLSLIGGVFLIIYPVKKYNQMKRMETLEWRYAEAVKALHRASDKLKDDIVDRTVNALIKYPESPSLLLYRFADEHGMLSDKESISEFNAWLKENKIDDICV